jgi:DNA-binding LacI/PurR family transcriptional regulator
MQPPDKPLVSLRHVAAAAGVSRMTASRALREGTPVGGDVRERVRAAAARLGYRRDRMVSELMRSFARQHVPEFREVLAALWWEPWPEMEGGNLGFHCELRRGLHAGAERFGCRIDDLLIPAKASRGALQRLLRARGIQGVLILPPADDSPAPELEWGELSVVAVGSSLQEPEMNRAQHHHYNAMSRALRAVRVKGYRRPAFLMQSRVEERARRAYLGAFLAWQGVEQANLVHPDAHDDDPKLPDWLRRARPDVVVAENDQLLGRLMRAEKRPQRVGWVSLDVNDPGGPIAGIYKDTRRMAECAVELLVHARWRRETGLPVEPLTLMNEGVWVEGQTLPRKSGGR